MKKQKKLIGFWNDKYNSYPEFPNPRDFIDNVDYSVVADYIDKNMKKGSAYKGYSICRICGKPNGSCDKYDDNFICPEGYSHYIRDHKVVPDKDLIEFVFNKYKSKKN